MTEKISETDVLKVLNSTYKICKITNKFSFTHILKQNNMAHLLDSIIECGFIEKMASRGNWEWKLKRKPDIDDAAILLAYHEATLHANNDDDIQLKIEDNNISCEKKCNLSAKEIDESLAELNAFIDLQLTELGIRLKAYLASPAPVILPENTEITDDIAAPNDQNIANN